jgi:putative transcriptional regulator
MITCRLAAVAKRKQLSLYRLRQITGVTYPTLLKLAHNKAKRFDAQVLDKLCQALNCDVGDLLVWEARRFPRVAKGSSQSRKLHHR